MVTLTSIVAIGLVVGTLAGIVVAAPLSVGASTIDLGASAGGPTTANHGSCVVSAIRSARGIFDLGHDFGRFVQAMARRC